jgi:N-acetylglucosaminyl-diphospho-decaprenol L-rhamnosyltransferase
MPPPRLPSLPTGRPDLSVCIVNDNNIDLLRSCLRAVFDQTAGMNREVIVVDNASEDDSADLIEQEFPDVHLLRGAVRQGYTPNMNRAIRASRGRLVALLNDDAEPTGDALGRLSMFLDKHAAYGAVGPRLVNTDGSFQIGPRGHATPLAFFSNESGLSRLFPFSAWGETFSLRQRDPNQSGDMATASGACLVLRREVFETVGLLEERLPLGPDDVEFSERMRRGGWKLHYAAEAIVVHHSSASRGRRLMLSMVALYSGWNWIFTQRFGRRRALALQVCVAAAAAGRSCLWAGAWMCSTDAARALAESRMRQAWITFRANLCVITGLGPRVDMLYGTARGSSTDACLAPVPAQCHGEATTLAARTFAGVRMDGRSNA